MISFIKYVIDIMFTNYLISVNPMNSKVTAQPKSRQSIMGYASKTAWHHYKIK